jgi:hypothetical protein
MEPNKENRKAKRVRSLGARWAGTEEVQETTTRLNVVALCTAKLVVAQGGAGTLKGVCHD